MRRADEVFTFEQRAARSPMVEQVWQTRSEPDARFISAAVSHWEMVVTRLSDATEVTVRGPETRATAATIPRDAAFFGIQFSLGTFMPRLPPGPLVDRALTLSPATTRSFWLDGFRIEIPAADDVDAFVDRLVRAGVLVHDPIVSAAARGSVQDLSSRSVQRRVARATGLRLGQIRQIRRAQAAVQLLSRGVCAIDAAHRAGYADQAHLTRSLKRFVGQTPSQIAAPAAAS
ncbi:MAG TPA: helix-turn-helix domain-containing protein [Solirubrobacteraceae bacterium]|nr:helix-turn-helix domain-containing protein [Solirubrobacteraceae bacterium]